MYVMADQIKPTYGQILCLHQARAVAVLSLLKYHLLKTHPFQRIFVCMYMLTFIHTQIYSMTVPGFVCYFTTIICFKIQMLLV